MVDIKCYAVVGVKDSVFSISSCSAKTVGDLKKELKELQPVPIDCDANDLQLFLVQKGNGWLQSYEMKGKTSTLLKALLHAKEELREEEVLLELGANQPSTDKINVLMAVPRKIITGKVRKREWFPHDFVSSSVDNHVLRHIQMTQFPPVAHPRQKYSNIMERESYKVIFSELMDKVKDCLERKADANMVVTGNPGAGLSRFYLYFAFQLLQSHVGKQVQERSQFELVLSSDDTFHKYCAKDDTFIELDKTEVHDLSQQRPVLRLIEGNSSRLLGWKGVSILFASPGLKGLHSFAKYNTFTYYLPDSILTERFDKHGGNPRIVFTETQPENDVLLNRAIANFDAAKVVSYIECNTPVTDEDPSSCVLQMVPSHDNFRANYHLDFLSDDIAEKIVLRVSDENLEKVVKFAVGPTPDDIKFQGNLGFKNLFESENRRLKPIRDNVFKLLCHRWFSLTMMHTLYYRSPSSEVIRWGFNITLNEELPTVRFSSLEEIPAIKEWTYYWPKAETFKTLDAFLLVSEELLGFRMTRDQEPEIEVAPLDAFLNWSESVGFFKEKFYLVLVVPNDIEKEFKMPETSSTQGPLANIKQVVAGLDVCTKTTWRYDDDE